MIKRKKDERKKRGEITWDVSFIKRADGEGLTSKPETFLTAHPLPHRRYYPHSDPHSYDFMVIEDGEEEGGGGRTKWRERK